MTTDGIPPLEPCEITTSHELVLTTLAELGGELAHGYLTPEGAARSYAFRPPTMGTRKRLGALRARRDLQRSPGKHTCYWLATALQELGGVDMGEVKLDAAALRVAELTVGDVLLLLFAWQALGHPDGLPLTAQGCGVCGHPFDRVLVELGTLEVQRLPREGDVYPEGHELEGQPMEPATSNNPPLARVGLPNGFAFPTGKHTSTVLVRPPTWGDTFWTMGQEQLANTELLRAATLRSQICGVDSCAARKVTPAAIDELWPADVRLIDDAGGRVTPTPVLEISVPCPSCESVNRTVLDWQESAFFGSSAGG